jgi:virginiamycin A acetyltransferase
MTARTAGKRAVQAAALLLAVLPAAASGFGRVRPAYEFFAHCCALAPGMPGTFLRAAYYRLTLRRCPLDVAIGFGTVLVHPGAVVGRFVSMGCYCVIGKARIGERTEIASLVQVTNGRHDHRRDESGALVRGEESETVIGAYCWIGSSAIVMAEVGDRSTIGAGAVVVKPIPPDSVAVGNPARVIRSAQGA